MKKTKFQTEDFSKKMARHARDTWKDPVVRQRRITGLKAAWRSRRRELSSGR